MSVTTTDDFLGGRIRLLQPADGYRAGLDAVFLAAFVDAPTGGRVLDLGCGTGAAALCLAARRPDLHLTGLDADPRALGLARQSVALNGLDGRVALVGARVEDGLPRQAFDAVMTNPPYLVPGQGTRPADSRAAAHMEGGADLGLWLDEAIKALRPKGRLHIVHRADRLPEILRLIEPRLGAIVIHPLWPRAGEAARRVLVAASLDRRSPAVLHPGTVLHEADGGFTPAAQAVLRDGAGLS
ncbi:tRNA1(Val) (adenine(37)-N6)-methyltransferase [Zavarzinia compransoris]|uniref:Methyltransferase n=1 Tax=Zavarzinia compransoris TaxID=1264899 RepID=A0A317E1W8_9PROT|nr:methyltransferase [Zavarzinia compransoris]PWR20592.1 methyltransferase [Zavarzinia compransoris]TDP43762.1 tRNA1(Val) A37 N6-methylase TrmN6 [Zavarzinia compransoris]